MHGNLEPGNQLTGALVQDPTAATQPRMQTSHPLDSCALAPSGGGLVVCESHDDSLATPLLSSHLVPSPAQVGIGSVSQRSFPRAHVE